MAVSAHSVTTLVRLVIEKVIRDFYVHIANGPRTSFEFEAPLEF